MPFYQEYPIDQLTPAPYNPRHLDDSAFAALQRSIRVLGMIKPVIIADNGTIVAGHQRSRAAREVGLTHVPVFIVNELNIMNEMKFNQLHNGTDLDTGDEHVLVPACESLGHYDIPAAAIKGNQRAQGASVRVAIAELMTLYGEWGGIVATQSGRCLSGAQYALTCKMLGKPCRVYYVPDDQALLVKGIFQREYGVFDYGKLPKTTYYQTFAQMYRKREDEQGRPRGVSAPFYEKVYIPNFKPGERILDFGCGQADYVRLLQKKGVRIWGIEFYFRAKQTINTIAVHQMADSLFASLHGDGRFDTVLCEFVLNSTDSLEAEAAVMTCLNALCKPGGRIYASGRTTKSIDDEMKATSKNQYALAFLDKNGYSARAVRGNWLYQKYHTVAEATALAKKYIGADAQYVELAGAPNTFLITGTKQHELPDDQVRAALEFEFNLMWPDGQHVGKHHEAQVAWEAARAKE